MTKAGLHRIFRMPGPCWNGWKKQCGVPDIEPGQHITFALDVAASELYDSTFQKYVFEGEGKMQGKPCVRSSEELIDYYEELLERFPIVSLEDPLDEEDWDGWELITTRLGTSYTACGGRLVCDKYEEAEKRNQEKSCKCDSDQSKSDRDANRSV